MNKLPIGRERVGVVDAAALLQVSVTQLKHAIRHDECIRDIRLPKPILIGSHYQFWLDELVQLGLHQVKR